MSMEALSQLTPEQLAMVPLMPNPNGFPPNFINPDTTGPESIGILSVFMGVMALILIMRFWSRTRITKGVGLDDLMASIAALCNATMFGFFVYLCKLKVLGPHAWDVRLIDYMSHIATGLLVTLQIFGNLANYFAKMSILLFIRRLFPKTVSPITAYLIIFGSILNTVACLALTLYLSIMCIPRVGASGAIPAQCTRRLLSQLGTAGAAINAFLDIYALAVSVPSLWMLRMPTRKKINVVGILAIGLAACTISLVTLAKRARIDPVDDPTRKQVVLVLLGILEPTIAIITASLPTLPALWVELSTNGAASLNRLFSKISGSTSMGTTRSRSKYSKTDEDSSVKSLQTHQMSDLEPGLMGSVTVTSKYEVSFGDSR